MDLHFFPQKLGWIQSKSCFLSRCEVLKYFGKLTVIETWYDDIKMFNRTRWKRKQFSFKTHGATHICTIITALCETRPKQTIHLNALVNFKTFSCIHRIYYKLNCSETEHIRLANNRFRVLAINRSRSSSMRNINIAIWLIVRIFDAIILAIGKELISQFDS